MKGLLLRVGIDKGSGGCLAPIFEDKSFEYIPIPENRATSETRLYANIKGITGRTFSEFVPEKIRLSHPHYDPEFVTFTYGDPTSPKRNQLSKLAPGDMLIFYAGLKSIDDDKSRLYVIGYFAVEEKLDFRDFSKDDYPNIFNRLQNNAHSKIYFRLQELNVDFSEKDLVIVRGNPKISKLLKKPLLISNKSEKLLKKLQPIFGYTGSLQRAIGHWITEENIHGVRQWLIENDE